MKPIRLKFVDMWNGFVPTNNYFYNLLSEKYEIELSDAPDYLIFSAFGHKHLQYDCVKIFYTAENQTPDFNVCDYAIGFNYLDYGDRYLRFPYYFLDKANFNLMLTKTNFTANDLAAKSGFCSFVYSNNRSSPERRQFYNLLDSYKTVSSGGRFMNNIGGAVKDKIDFQRNYKFCIAFENASFAGYTTEKLIHAFASQAVPIYWGDPLVSRYFNPKSFINCHDYSSFDEVVEKIKELDSNDAEYLKMLQTPALLNPNDNQEFTDSLKNFLFRILDSDIQSAKRYNRHYWGKKYVKIQRDIWRAYDRSFQGFLEKIYMRYFLKVEKKHKSIFLWKIHRLLMKITGRTLR